MPDTLVIPHTINKEEEEKKKYPPTTLQIFADYSHTFFLFFRKGKPVLMACGDNSDGSLGLGHNQRQNNLQPVFLPKHLISVKLMATYSSHTFILGQDAQDNPLIFACGDNSRGQLGLGHHQNQNQFQPVPIPEGMVSVKSAVTTHLTSFILGQNAKGKPMLFACGTNSDGQLGLGNNQDQNSFQPVPLPEDMVSLESVVANAHHIFVVGENEQGKPMLFACGYNHSGQLGLGNNQDQNSLQPVPLPEGMVSVKSVVTSNLSSFILGQNAQGKPMLFACGDNSYGQLGLGHQQNQNTFQPVPLPEGMVSLESVVTNGDHTFIVGQNAQGLPMVFACGSNHFGILGLGNNQAQNSFQPVPLPKEMVSVKSVATSGRHAFIVGQNAQGQPIAAVCGYRYADLRVLRWNHKDPFSMKSVVTGGKNTFIEGLDKQGEPMVFARGRNYSNQLGLGHSLKQKTFALVKPTIFNKEKTLEKLDAYRNKRENNSSDYYYFRLSRFFGGISKDKKLAAVDAVKDFFDKGTPIDKIHQPALENGELNKIIKARGIQGIITMLRPSP